MDSSLIDAGATVEKILITLYGQLRGLAAVFCAFIYEFIAKTYELLFAVSKIRLLSDPICLSSDRLTYLDVSEEQCLSMGGTFTASPISQIYQRVTLLLGIIMVFYITFQFIKYLIEPDEVNDKEKGVEKLGMKLIVVVALMALVPNIFDMAYELQEEVLDSQLISAVITGTRNIDDQHFGRRFSTSLLHKFYKFDDRFAQRYSSNEENSIERCDGYPCNKFVRMVYSEFLTKGTLKYMKYGLADRSSDRIDADFYIHFDAIFCLLVGVLILWMTIMYTLDTGTRVIQLVYLQVIAPIPIISYLSPKKDGMFQKWVKQCTTTYVDLFIRLSIIYFSILLIDNIDKAIEAGTLLRGVSEDLKAYIYIVLVLGLIRFCQKAAKLIEELFPKMGAASGSFGLKATDRIPANLINAATGAVTGAAVGFAGARMGHKIRGMLGGVARGTTTGAKSKDGVLKNIANVGSQQAKRNQQLIDWKNSGSTVTGRMAQRFDNAFGRPGKAEKTENQVKKLDEQIDANKRKSERYGKISTFKSNVEKRANSKLDIDGKDLSTDFGRNLQQQRRNYHEIYESLSNGNTANAITNAQKELIRSGIYNPTTGTVDMARFNSSRLKDIFSIDAAGNLTLTGTAADAKRAYGNVNDDTMKEYITAALSGTRDATGKLLIDDNVIINEKEDVQKTIQHIREKIRDDDSRFGLVLDRYANVDDMEKAAKNSNSVIERDTYDKEQEKEDILKSKEYQRAQADRNAVGGNKGGK